MFKCLTSFSCQVVLASLHPLPLPANFTISLSISITHKAYRGCEIDLIKSIDQFMVHRHLKLRIHEYGTSLHLFRSSFSQKHFEIFSTQSCTAFVIVTFENFIDVFHVIVNGIVFLNSFAKVHS